MAPAMLGKRRASRAPSRDLRTGTVTVNVPDTPPVAVNDSVSTPYQTLLNFDPRGNKYDPDGELLTITSETTPANGTLVIGGLGLKYRPNNGFFGTDRFGRRRA